MESKSPRPTPEARENDAPTKSDAGCSDPLWPYFIVPTAFWLLLSRFALMLLPHTLTLWLAVPLALVIGFVATFLFVITIGQAQGNTLLEVNVQMATWLILLLILIPVFTKAREKARYQAAIAHQRAIGQVSPTPAAPVVTRY